MNLPLVSCICPTYNRAPDYLHLIEESIECFLRQDYPHKELIVLNDTPGQELFFEAENVVIVNTPRRFRTLGEKRNAIVGMSTGDLIALWDDDDISLPWRLSLSVEKLGDNDYFNPRNYWAWWVGELIDSHPIGIGHNCSLYTRDAFLKTRGYTMISLGDDRDMDQALFGEGFRGYDSAYRNSPRLTQKELFYIYRFGSSPGHVSARGDDDVGLYAEIGKRRIATGCFELNPAWQRDYVAEVESFLNAATG